jgi:branched-chain amino acid transport system permease protein
MSLDLLVGYTGMVSFGHAAYYGIGAYSLGLLAPKYEAASLWTTLPSSVLLAAAAAFLVGLFVVRVRGIYFIMVTLAFAQMFYFVFHDTALGRGSDGIAVNFKPTAAIGDLNPIDLSNAVHSYFLVLCTMVLVFVFLRLLLRSALGRALQGIGSNEQRLRSLGFPVYWYKVASFTIAGGLAGLAGYLSAMQFGFVNPEILSWHQSGNVLLMLILGGLGTLYGGIAGAFVFVALQEIFSSLTTHWQLPLGVSIVLLVLFLPGGLASLGTRFRQMFIGAPHDG